MHTSNGNGEDYRRTTEEKHTKVHTMADSRTYIFDSNYIMISKNAIGGLHVTAKDIYATLARSRHRNGVKYHFAPQ